MSFKVAFIGAGSVGFTRKLVQDILGVPEFSDIEFSLMDINAQNLDMIAQLIARDVNANGLSDVKITTTTDQAEAVHRARYVINVARVGGLEAFATDIDIPLQYGVDQCVGDTLCAGGIMYGQRGIPMILNLCKDMREHAEPGALLLNYANPMAMLTWAANTYGGVNTVGLCHGVQGGHRQIADVLGVPQNEVDIVCAGINHQTWYVRVLHDGKEVTDSLLDLYEKHPTYSETEKVRIDVLRHFGYYSTESNGHLSEYLPWYRKRAEEIKNWISLDTWINGETGGYLRVCTEKRNWFEEDFPRWMTDEAGEYGPDHRSNEHGSHIIEGLETGRIYRGHFNRINGYTITNLPTDCVIEAPGYVDQTGIKMTQVGDLPIGAAAVCNVSINVQRLAVEAAVRADVSLLRQAFMLDPLTGAVCTTSEICQLVDDMLIAGAPWLPQYQEAISVAKGRRESGARVPTREYSGAARLAVKSVKELRDEESGLNVEARAFRFKQ
ncbi:MAG: alpha-glucosidase/alpha-galactosidase [Spirochaetaceae bacterium]|nr:MAG: alpha-glucosidase/alpha-galactosidase [Spirochaetaceae bacterium]